MMSTGGEKVTVASNFTQTKVKWQTCSILFKISSKCKTTATHKLQQNSRLLRPEWWCWSENDRPILPEMSERMTVQKCSSSWALWVAVLSKYDLKLECCFPRRLVQCLMHPVHRKKNTASCCYQGCQSWNSRTFQGLLSRTTINLFSGTFTIALSALTPLVGHHEEHLACKKVMSCWLAWLSVWSKVQVICIYSPANATATPSSLAASLGWLELSGAGLPRLSWKRGR